jgi:hypothetical protein
MSIIKYKYHNYIDDGSVATYSSQLSGLPATNVQQELLTKVWRTDSGFVVTSKNNNLPFHNTSTSSVLNAAINSGTYTGATLAAAIQSGLNSTVGAYTNHECSYTGYKFIISRTSTSTGTFGLAFDDAIYKDKTLAVLLGFAFNTPYDGRVQSSTVTTLGNEHFIDIDLSATSSITCFIIDNHNITTNGTVRLRGANATGLFDGPWNVDAGITLSSTITTYADMISVELTGSYKALQLHWYDRTIAYSEIGRLWAGGYFQPEHKRTNTITYARKLQKHRTQDMISQSGASYKDKKEKIFEYVISHDPLDQYYNPTTLSGYEDMTEEVEDNRSFYISLEHNIQTTTIYGYLVGDFDWQRVKNTPTMTLRDFVFREQK